MAMTQHYLKDDEAQWQEYEEPLNLDDLCKTPDGMKYVGFGEK